MDREIEDRIAEFERALLSLNFDEAKRLMTGGDGLPRPIAEMEAVIVPALERIGSGWEDGRVALSQVYMSGRQCERLMNEFRTEAPIGEDIPPSLAIVVLDDYHLLGMRLVSSVLRASGFALRVYGRMEMEELVRRVEEDRIELLLVSVLMLRSALRVRELRDRLDRTALRAKIAVGGAPFRLDKDLWREVGSDGTADTAAGAAALVKRLGEERPR